MSSGEGALQLQNNTAPENKPIETCHQLIKSRDFLAARFIAHMNQLVSSKRYDQFEQARAICDVLIAAEHPFPNGLMDCYGMIRVNRLGPVLLEDFTKLMKILDKVHNPFPFCQEAADKASLAWSLLSKPLIKARYDLAISAYSSQSRGGLRGDGSKGRVQKGKRKMAFSKIFPDYVIPKKHNVNSETDDEAVTMSDDDGQEIMTMARAAKLCKINGTTVKVIPLEKKQN